MLCRKWESDGGEQTTDQVIFLEVFDRLLLRLIIVILLEVIVMYRRPYVLFDIIITSQNLLQPVSYTHLTLPTNREV